MTISENNITIQIGTSSEESITFEIPFMPEIMLPGIIAGAVRAFYNDESCDEIANVISEVELKGPNVEIITARVHRIRLAFEIIDAVKYICKMTKKREIPMLVRIINQIRTEQK